MKKIGKGLCLLFSVLLLTGCMKFNVRINVKSANEIDYGIEYLMSESALKASGEDVDSYMKSMEEEMKKELGTTENVQSQTVEKVIDDEKWVGVDVSTTLKGAEAQKICKEQEKDGKKQLVVDFSELLDNNDMLDEADTSMYDPEELGIEMKMVVTMPSTPTTTFGEVKGNEVHIDIMKLLSSQTTEMKITCDVSTQNFVPYILIGGALIVGVIAFVIYKKKKTPAEPVPSNPSDNEESE